MTWLGLFIRMFVLSVVAVVAYHWAFGSDNA